MKRTTTAEDANATARGDRASMRTATDPTWSRPATPTAVTTTASTAEDIAAETSATTDDQRSRGNAPTATTDPQHSTNFRVHAPSTSTSTNRMAKRKPATCSRIVASSKKTQRRHDADEATRSNPCVRKYTCAR